MNICFESTRPAMWVVGRVSFVQFPDYLQFRQYMRPETWSGRSRPALPTLLAAEEQGNQSCHQGDVETANVKPK
jgi:hypothetical protein